MKILLRFWGIADRYLWKMLRRFGRMNETEEEIKTFAPCTVKVNYSNFDNTNNFNQSY